MRRRTTIEIDEELLARARRALGQSTTRATVEKALRLAADQAEGAQTRRAEAQRRYLKSLNSRGDTAILSSGEMWH